MEFLRTPDERFGDLPGYDFDPHYCEVAGPADTRLRMHYVDEGASDAPPVLMVHGEPTWSYLYRKLIASVSGSGLRAVAPDHIGFGRSDKLVEKTAYSFEGHIDWLHSLVRHLDLKDITLVVQDWGGPIGLGVLAREPERFSRIVVANTILHTAEAELEGRLTWSNHGVGEADVRISEGLLNWIAFSQRSPKLDASMPVRASTLKPLSDAELSAYDAPFPDERYKAGMRQFPILIPITRNGPGAAINRATWRALSRFDGPLLTAFSDGDPGTGGWDAIFRERVPGARGQRHRTLTGAGHFLQEDAGEELAEIVIEFAKAGR